MDSSISWCAPRCTAPLEVVRNSRSASSTCSGLCDVAPESRYANWFPPRITRFRIGKSARIASEIRAVDRTDSRHVRPPSRLGEALVAVGFELVGQFGAAGLDDATAEEHVHELRLDVAQDAGVVRDQQDAAVLGFGVAVDALADHAQRVDVQAGVGLVEDRDLRLEQTELQDLVALLLAAGEAFVDTALGERRVDVEVAHRAP